MAERSLAAVEPQRPVIAAAAGLATALAIAAGTIGGARLAVLAVIGVLAGFALFKASFGFTSAWRRALTERRTLGLRAQVVMVGVTTLAFLPLMSAESFLGQPISGFIFPVGAALCLGAFLFGVGMQLGGGCGSGALFSAGAGNTRMWATLFAFVVGSFIATADPMSWRSWPSFDPVSLTDTLGLPSAMLAAAAMIGLIYTGCVGIERSRHGDVEPLRAENSRRRWLTGPWPILAGAVALSFVNIATLLTAGRPWGITSAFALWGAKAAILIGLDPSDWDYWRGDASLHANLLTDTTSVMDFGLLVGSLLAVGLAGGFALTWRTPKLSLCAAILGGLLMGFGARLSTGCNVGAFFSGASSGSLHGIVWVLFAIPGNALGVRLRPLFGLQV